MRLHPPMRVHCDKDKPQFGMIFFSEPQGHKDLCTSTVDKAILREGNIYLCSFGVRRNLVRPSHTLMSDEILGKLLRTLARVIWTAKVSYDSLLLSMAFLT